MNTGMDKDILMTDSSQAYQQGKQTLQLVNVQNTFAKH